MGIRAFIRHGIVFNVAATNIGIITPNWHSTRAARHATIPNADIGAVYYLPIEFCKHFDLSVKQDRVPDTGTLCLETQ